MRRYISNDQDWEQVDDEDCWGVNYTEPSTLIKERIDQGLLTIFIKIKAHRGDPLNEQADRWADEGRQSENIRWSLPTNAGMRASY